ncbi:MAG TPA: RNA-binding protein [bacterium]|nr:RNA-binding protein [bacterium]
MDRDENDRPAEAKPNKRIFVGGLAWAATPDDLREAFAQFGNVVNATVVTDRMTGRSRGFGFVEFETVEEAVAAKDTVNADPEFKIKDRGIHVDFAQEERARS